MSRIAGIVGVHDPHVFSRMLEQLTHGAASRISWRRKSFRDQSMNLGGAFLRSTKFNEQDGMTLVIDGWVYNWKDVGKCNDELSQLLALYKQVGFAQMLSRLNGDFSIALWDSREQTLWLGRDRIGVKPLYYVQKPDYFAFASRPRSLLQLPGMQRNINRRFSAIFAGSHYRYFDNHPEESPYEEIAQLPAAHWLKYHDGGLAKGCYWFVDDHPDYDDTEDMLAGRYRELLVDAVKIRLRTADRPAFTLSGGMDSSSVLASAVKITGNKQNAFSSVYEDKTFDETDEIQPMLDRNVEQWFPVKVGKPDILEVIKRMIDVHDEPVATATWLSHFILCERVAEQGFGGLFGGLGGDELNAGEYEYFFYYFADLERNGQNEQLNREISKWVEYHDHPVYRKNKQVVEEYLGRCVDLDEPGICLPDHKRMKRYYHALNPEFYQLDSFEPVMQQPFHSYLTNRTFQDITRETAPCCLRAEDRQTMAFGLDNFVPFFDHRLVEFMFRIPGKMKINNGITKILLRNAMRGILPEETRTRIKKTGWNAPAHLWFSGKGADVLKDLINSQGFKNRGIYNVRKVTQLLDEHEVIVGNEEKRENHMMFFWQLVNLELWLQSI